MSFRFDKAHQLGKARRLDNGWLEVDAYITRSGVFTYIEPDGSVVKEYRPPDEVFKKESLDSFELRPLTNDHPPELLNDTNTSVFQVGTVGKPERDGDRARVKILVTDANTIAGMEAGKLEMSSGYERDIDPTPGVSPEGERYDCVQRSIRGNHVALVDRGRAGSSVRARLDSASNLDVLLPHTPELPEFGKEIFVKIRLDSLGGIEAEIPDAAAALVEKELAARAAAVTAAKDEVQKQTARADSLDNDLKQARKDLAEAPTKAKAELKARVDLESKARNVLGESVKMDGLSDVEIKSQVAKSVYADMSLDGKPAAYIDGVFEAALVKNAAETQGIAGTREDSAETLTDKDPEQAFNKLVEAQSRAGK